MTVKLMPFDTSGEVVELSQGSNIFEKQILPIGEFKYTDQNGNTRDLNITQDYVKEIVRAFEEKALDQTPFALADERNSHNVDERPDRYGGEVLKLISKPQGLSAIYRLTDKAASMVRENRKLGVSARIKEDYSRIDGQSWPVVIDQVLGTLNPKMTGMSPWKEVKLSNIEEGESVEDYTNNDWNKSMTKPDEGEKVTLTKEEYDQFKSLLAKGKEEAPHKEDEDDDLEYSDEDLDKALTDLDKEEKETTKLSNENDSKVVKLSREVAEGRFERDSLAWRQAGVPPKLIELARPVLSSYDSINVVELSNGKEKNVDARDILKNMLNEMKGTVDLSNEDGHSNRDSTGEDEEYKQITKGLLDELNSF